MLWKVAFVAVLAVGVFGGYTITEVPWKEKQVIIEFCRRANAEDKATGVEAAIITYQNCVNSHFDAEVGLEKAMRNGAFGELFKTYCAISSELKSCYDAVVTGVTPCVPTELRKNPLAFTNANNILIDFVCYKNDMMASLFAEEGVPQCVQEKMEAMLKCINGNVKTVIHKIIELDDCSQVDRLSKCIMTTLKSCKSPSPANMAEKFFKIWKKKPCSEEIERNGGKNELHSYPSASTQCRSYWQMSVVGTFLIGLIYPLLY